MTIEKKNKNKHKHLTRFVWCNIESDDRQMEQFQLWFTQESDARIESTFFRL